MTVWTFYPVENFGNQSIIKISLLFLTLETLDFESEQVFESHEHLQSTADMMPVLTCFYMDHIGPNLGQIAPKQPIFKVETQDIGLWYVFVNTHLYKCIHYLSLHKWPNGSIGAKLGQLLGQIWPKRVELDRSTYHKNLPFWLKAKVWLILVLSKLIQK